LGWDEEEPHPESRSNDNLIKNDRYQLEAPFCSAADTG
jgi:hypothetical protein